MCNSLCQTRLLRTFYTLQSCVLYLYETGLGHYVTCWKVAGSSSDEVNFFSYLIHPVALWP
jgi:hypothetical protein